MGNMFSTCNKRLRPTKRNPEPDDWYQYWVRKGYPIPSVDASYLFQLALEGRADDLRLYLDNNVWLQGDTDARNRVYPRLLTCRVNFVEQAMKYAAQNGHTETCKVLFEYGEDISDINLEELGGPLFVAAEKGHLETVVLLLEHGVVDDYAIYRGVSL